MDELSEQIIGCEIVDVKSNVLRGTLGAILGALLGGALWVLVYQLGYIAFIAGVAIIFCSYKGYILFSKRKDKKAAVISTIVSFIVLIAAHCVCWGIDIYNAFKYDYDITFFDALIVVPEYAVDPDFSVSFFKDLLIGLVLIVVGFFTYIRSDLKKAAKSQTDAPAGAL